MKKPSLLLLLILLFKISYSQDTLYLDKSFKITQKATADYFEIVSPANNAFEVDFYSVNHELLSKETYLDKTLKTLDGPAVFYYQNGKKDSEGNYVNKNREGVWNFYFMSGQLSARVNFKNDNIIDGKYFEMDGQPLDSLKNDHPPQYNGGNKAMVKYIQDNLTYPEKLAKSNIHGRVVVGFTISREGQVKDVHINTSLNEDIDKEAIRVISNMPNWEPGVQFNRPVNVQYAIPLGF